MNGGAQRPAEGAQRIVIFRGILIFYSVVRQASGCWRACPLVYPIKTRIRPSVLLSVCLSVYLKRELRPDGGAQRPAEGGKKIVIFRGPFGPEMF